MKTPFGIIGAVVGIWFLLGIGVWVAVPLEPWMVVPAVCSMVVAIITSAFLIKRVMWGLHMGGVFVFVAVGAISIAVIERTEIVETQMLESTLAVIPAALLSAIWVLVLLTRRSREHFALICPECGSRRFDFGDFLMKNAKCKKCGEEWTRG
jgi:hypothetical protein